MKLDIRSLPQGSGDVELESDSRQLDLRGADVSFEGPVWARMNIVRHQDNLLIKGLASGTITGECFRCLDVFHQPLQQDFTVYAERKPEGGIRGLDRELLTDHYLCFHDGISLDMRDEVREALLLGIPLQPLCRPGCKGLCAGCGANLNSEACTCAGRAAESASPGAKI